VSRRIARRELLRGAAGLTSLRLAAAAGGGFGFGLAAGTARGAKVPHSRQSPLGNGPVADAAPRPVRFTPYRPGETIGTVLKVSPDDGFYLHTFYDECPFSPSGRILCVNRVPYQDQVPAYGDLCDICLIDLEAETIETVYKTLGWGFQLGANLNWGASDRHLYTNDILDGRAVCVRIDLETREARAFSGPMYDIEPRERSVLGFPLDLINDTQGGYGVPEYRDRDGITGAPADEGIWQTDLATDETRLLLSLAAAVEAAADPFLAGGNQYFFHTKWNPQGTRILQVLRTLFPGRPEKKGWNPTLLTMRADGSAIRKTVSREHWRQGGNHPNWHPDGDHIVMNLTPAWLGDPNRRFVSVHHSGEDLRILSRRHLGSGHMRVTPDWRYLVADCYQREPMADASGQVPIRLLDLVSDEEVEVCRIFTNLDRYTAIDKMLRIDPHPEWNRSFDHVCFNAAPDGKRQVLIADLADEL